MAVEQQRGRSARVEAAQHVGPAGVIGLRHAAGRLRRGLRRDAQLADLEAQAVQLGGHDLLGGELPADRARRGDQSLQELKGRLGAVADRCVHRLPVRESETSQSRALPHLRTLWSKGLIFGPFWAYDEALSMPPDGNPDITVAPRTRARRRAEAPDRGAGLRRGAEAPG